MGECEVQRFTRITLNNQVITILTEDEPKLIEALTIKPSFQSFIAEKLSCNNCLAGPNGTSTLCEGCYDFSKWKVGVNH